MFSALSRYLMARYYERLMQRSEKLGLGEWRHQLLSQATGRVLEIGAGTGSNLPHYPPDIELLLSEPDPYMRRKLHQHLAKEHRSGWQITDWTASDIPLPANSLDTVVSTLVLCSVNNQAESLVEIYRLLRPGGRLLFIEHIAAEDAGIRRWQQRLEPFWSSCCGNCHLTRETIKALTSAGFQLQSCTEDALPGAPAIVRRSVRGTASKPVIAED